MIANKHYPSRNFIANLNNTLLLNKIEPIYRCLMADLKQFVNHSSLNGVSIQQSEILEGLANIPNVINILYSSKNELDRIENLYNSLESNL